MRPIQLIFIMVSGVPAILLEFQNIKSESIFSLALVGEVPFIILGILTAVYIIRNISRFIKSKNYFLFIPALIGMAMMALIFRHKQWRSSVDNSETIFTATNYDIGSDGGFILDFKTGNNLKAEKRDHWLITYYWGSYKKQGDTLLLDIPLNFKLGRHAILDKKVMSFSDDTVRFEVHEPLLLPTR